MIKKTELIEYFWKEGNMITSEEGVEVALHGDSLIEVSVMLRNTLEIDVDGLMPMVQLHTEFEDFEVFQRVMKIAQLEDLHRITLEEMMVLYASGQAALYKARY